MPLTVAQGFEAFLQRLTPPPSQIAARARHRASVDACLKAHFPQSVTWEIGSFTHGTGVRNHLDADLLVSIREPVPTDSATALRWLKRALQDSFPGTYIRVARPAVVAEFASGTETWEVVPGFLTGRGGSAWVYDIPGPLSDWIDSAPLAHRDYVNQCNSRDGTKGGAKSLARLMKAWKYYNDVPISSFYLEMRAAQHMATQTSFLAIWDVCLLLDKLVRHELADMVDPTDVAVPFRACSSIATRSDALQKVRIAATRASEALDAHRRDDPASAFHWLDLLFGSRFPSR